MRSTAIALLIGAALLGPVLAGCGNNKGNANSSTTQTVSKPGPGGMATTMPEAAVSAAASAAAATPAPTPTTGGGEATQIGDAHKGKVLFSANCSTCHGATGREGGVGPSLTNERAKKNYAQTVAWIENPNPPMPKLYPSPLSLQDVRDLAAYVQQL